MSEEHFPTDPQGYPEASQATTVLVLGILGLVVCGVLAPFAWVMGNRELEAIRAGRRPPENRSTANAGRILGIIGTVLIGLVVLFFIFVLGLGIAFSGALT
jgi:uncharacterized membrane protein YjgN (DUF898 family)